MVHFLFCFLFHRTTGFFRKILKKRPHKEAQTPEDGDLSVASFLDQREGSQCLYAYVCTVYTVLLDCRKCPW